MHKMTDDGYRHFLIEHAHTPKVATVRADGGPHVTPAWIALDGDTIVLTTGEGSAKARHLRRR